MSNAINPTARLSMVPSVIVPKMRTLTVARFTSEETGEFYAPVSHAAAATPKTGNTVQSVARTVRPARRRAA